MEVIIKELILVWQQDAQKKEANQALNDKSMDDGGDFLQQIRAKVGMHFLFQNS